MNSDPCIPSQTAASAAREPMGFLQKLLIVTLSLLLVVLAVFLLRRFQAIFQPLLVAAFIGYVILPVHHWLVARGAPSLLAGGIIVLLILAALFGMGLLVFRSVEHLAHRLPGYEKGLEDRIIGLAQMLPVEVPTPEPGFLRQLPITPEQATAAARAALGSVVDFFAGLAVVAVYLIFLMIEKYTFPRRLERALGETRGRQVREVMGAINLAIGDYLLVKAFASFLTGVLTWLVVAAFGVHFAVMWGILTFFLCFIPILGGIMAATGPILLGFIQLGPLWQPAALALLLIALHQFIGNFLEPRMTGQRLDVSPLLILVSLSFWGLLWGMVGMILAVPLLMTVKIILGNIPETRPIAVLMSNG